MRGPRVAAGDCGPRTAASAASPRSPAMRRAPTGGRYVFVMMGNSLRHVAEAVEDRLGVSARGWRMTNPLSRAPRLPRCEWRTGRATAGADRARRPASRGARAHQRRASFECRGDGCRPHCARGEAVPTPRSSCSPRRRSSRSTSTRSSPCTRTRPPTYRVLVPADTERNLLSSFLNHLSLFEMREALESPAPGRPERGPRRRRHRARRRRWPSSRATTVVGDRRDHRRRPDADARRGGGPPRRPRGRRRHRAARRRGHLPHATGPPRPARRSACPCCTCMPATGVSADRRWAVERPWRGRAPDGIPHRPGAGPV